MGKPLSPSQSVSDLPNLADPAAEAERSEITCIADTGVREVTDVTCPATAGMTQADYILITAVGGLKYAFWLDKDANGSAPTGAAYVAADTKTKVSIATGDTATVVATAVKNAINTAMTAKATATSALGVVTVTQSKVGTVTDIARHNADDSGNGSFTLSVTTQGVASNLQNKKFLLYSPTTTYYAWLNVDGAGADPTGTGTGIECAITGAASASSVATNLAAALEAHAAFLASSNGSKVSLTNAVGGTATDVAESNSGFSFLKKIEGKAASYGPATLVDSISNNP